MRSDRRILVIFALLFSGINIAVAQSQNVLFIAGDHLVMQINLKSPAKEIDSIIRIAGIAGINAQKVLRADFSAIEKDGWNMASRKNDVIRFERSLSVLNNNPQTSPARITTRIPNFGSSPGYPDEAEYGVNRYSLVTVFGLSSGLTRFILPGHTHARRVFLSGSFNGWSTLSGVMKKIGGGWMIDIKLDAGAFQYKYIIDGHWSTDPNNLTEVDDGAGNTNSIFYKYNYTIKLRGYPSAHKVLIAGDFNDWNENELVMDRKGNNWIRQLYLKDGKHTYHFLVDGHLVTDPENPAKQKGKDGKLNSVLTLGEMVKFKLNGYTNAKKVFLAGDFNDWRPNENWLEKIEGGWVQRLKLTAGNYQYKFIVDGEWITDPANQHYAVEKGEKNSFIAVKPNHTFKLKGNAGAASVTLEGNFDGLDSHGCTMAHIGDEWVVGLYLKPGKYLYKFRVDDQLIVDPDNKFWEPADNRTNSSVLWIEY